MLIHHDQFNKDFHMDTTLCKNLSAIRDIVVKKKFDWLFLVCGKERFGKSTFAQQCAYHLANNKLDQEDVALSFSEFHKRVIRHLENGNKGRSVIYDETMGVADTRSFNNIYNKKLRRLLTECGQANLFLFIILPSFFDLDKPIGIHRSNTLFRIEVDRSNFSRGLWYMYNDQTKQKLYLDGKKTMTYKVKPNLWGRFTDFYCVDEKIYSKRKANVLKTVNVDDVVGPKLSRVYEQRDRAIRYLKERIKLSQREIGKITNLAQTQISTILRQNKGNLLEN